MAHKIGLLGRQLSLAKRISNPLIFKRSNYYFVLPEVPSDTAETNALLRNDNLPALDELDIKKIQNGFQKLSINFDNDLNTILDQVSEGTIDEQKFDKLFHEIEKSFAPLDYAYKTARHLAFIKPYSKYYVGYAQIEGKMSKRKDERWTNRRFFSILKELESSKHLLNTEQTRLLERSINFCVLNGLHFNEAEYTVCTELNNKIQDQQSFFKQRLNYANKIFELRLSESMPLDEIPLKIKSMVSIDRSNPNKGPWTLIPNEEVFKSFMKYSSNRSLRKTYYDAYYSRASYINEQLDTNNSEIIKNLLSYRKEQAKLYGYENYAQLVLESNAAVNVDNVIDMFDKIKTNLKPLADEHLQKLQKFSASEGNLTPLDNCDIEFWRTKHTEKNYGIDQARLMQYFPLNKVLNGLIEFTKNMFNVEFNEDTTKKHNLWDPNVIVYNVHDENNQHISTLCIDPFIRSRKINHIWSYTGRDSSEIAGHKPLAYLMMNAPNMGNSSHLTFDQVQTLFSEFGKCVQILLTKTNYTELSDHNSIETDAFGLSSKLYSKFLYTPEMMNLISSHQQTGDTLPVDMIERLKNGQSNLNLFQLMNQTYLSAFDIECHMSDKFWTDIAEELWPKFNPIKMSERDFRPCQFVSTFGENFSCKYYSHLWTDMLVSDLYEAFKDVGLENKNKIKDVGIKFRETILKHGSSTDSNELFRQFRGRNPSMDPFLKSYMNVKQ